MSLITRPPPSNREGGARRCVTVTSPAIGWADPSRWEIPKLRLSAPRLFRGSYCGIYPPKAVEIRAILREAFCLKARDPRDFGGQAEIAGRRWLGREADRPGF